MIKLLLIGLLFLIVYQLVIGITKNTKKEKLDIDEIGKTTILKTKENPSKIKIDAEETDYKEIK